MLAPADRQTLFDALRPPQGTSVDLAVATTFTLSLEALLSAPLAFTMASGSTSPLGPDEEPIGLLHALKAQTGRLIVFCQAGQIAVPAPRRPVLAWLEDAIVEARAPRAGGIFHPKLWVLRFIDANGDTALIRVLCGSRNLTFDHSWDTHLRLEGAPSDGGPVNGSELADLLDWLPQAAIREMPSLQRAAIGSLAADLRRTDFAVPEPFRSLRFHPMGFDGTRPPAIDGPHDRALIVSPFLGPALVERVSMGTGRTVIVSRPEALAGLQGNAVLESAETYTLTPDIDADPTAEDDAAEAEGLSGLHAKLLILDRGSTTRVLTGSANATEAAFSSGVELLCELEGDRVQVGVEALMHEPDTGEPSFRSLLASHSPGSIAPDEEADALQRKVDRLALTIVEGGVLAKVEAADGADFRLRISAPTIDQSQLSGLSLRAWPVTLPKDFASVAVQAGTALEHVFPVTLEAVTAFVGFEASLVSGSARPVTFVVKAELEGAPEHRHDRILAAMMRDPERFIAYLLSLLGLIDSEAEVLGQAGEGEGTRRFGGGAASAPLLELLLRAAASGSTERLEDVARLVADLKTVNGAVLPEGFLDIWEPVASIMKEAL